MRKTVDLPNPLLASIVLSELVFLCPPCSFASYPGAESLYLFFCFDVDDVLCEVRNGRGTFPLAAVIQSR